MRRYFISFFPLFLGRGMRPAVLAVNSWAGESPASKLVLSCLDRAAGSSMNRSTTQRIAPAGLDGLAVLYDAWNRRIAARIFEHLGAKLFIRLRVAIDERNAFRIVVFAGLLTVRTIGFCVDH